ncbi:MAG: hypothetical protein PWP51_2104 [Clostridiales bacterium]|jgi:tRNA nucleotidyltransferase/poly(A) polymerase|nr:hypothetical protein [Clostridiales bacterium]
MGDILRLRELLMQLLEIETVKFFFVGGLIRDLLVHRQTNDIDIAFEGDFDRVYRQLSKTYAVTASRVSTMQLAIGGYAIDLAMMRQEVYPNADGFPIIEPASVKVDMKRRDFTVNTAYALICEENIDAVCRHLTALRPMGLEIAYAHEHFLRDLNNRALAVLHPLSFEEDPTRLIRVVKYTVVHGFKMDRKTRRFYQSSVEAGAINRLPASRLYGALLKVMRLPEWLEAAAFITEHEVLSGYFDSTLPSVDAACAKRWLKMAPDNAFYRFAVLLGDGVTCFAAQFGKRVIQYLNAAAALKKLSSEDIPIDGLLYALYCQVKNLPLDVCAALGYRVAFQHPALLSPYDFIVSKGLAAEAPIDGNQLKMRGILNIREAKSVLMAAQLAKLYLYHQTLTAEEIEQIIAER